jgi:Cellulase (glycosyl hydrolase family 5)
MGNLIARRALLKAGVGLAASLAFGQNEARDPYSHIRGFNYQPSWSSSGFVLWQQFKPELFHLELGQGKKFFPGINTIRLWLSFDAFAGGDAAHQKTVASNFETALAIANSYHLKVIPVLFNNWHSVPDFGGIAGEMIEYWMNDHDRNHTIPTKIFMSYLDAFVGDHASDDRILIWDLCNEPFNSGVTPALSHWLESLYRKCKELKASAPIGVGMAPSVENLKLLDPVSDVLTIHPYGNLKFLDAAIAYGRKVRKPVLATESCWGSLDDAERAKIVATELGELRQRNLGFLAHVLHHSLVADCHRPQYGPVSGAGYMAFIEADGSLRPHHEIFNKFV